MLTYSEARNHAISCGFVLGPVDAVPLNQVIRRSKSGKGSWPAVDIVNPENMAVVHPAGMWIDDADIPKFEALGLDYLILEN
jgi:hypothetical protein